MSNEPSIARALAIENKLKRAFYVIGVEDLILDRLRACVHWHSESDCEWAQRLLAIHHREIDWKYLSQTAEAENLKERLDALDPGGESS